MVPLSFWSSVWYGVVSVQCVVSVCGVALLFGPCLGVCGGAVFLVQCDVVLSFWCSVACAVCAVRCAVYTV